MWLTKAEASDLTGYHQPSKQIAWLRRHRLRFFVAADGYPRIPRTAIDQPLTERRGPNLDAIRKQG